MMGIPGADALPAALTDRDQWVCWRTQERDGTQTKVPINPDTGAFASTTDADTWGTFAEARAYAVEGPPDGVGFVFTETDPIVGVDLDDCRDPDTATLTDDAADIVDRLDSYTEVSPSGTGVHVLVEGELPADRNRRGDVECYETARFFTVTGAHVDGTPSTVEPRQDAIDAVHATYLQPDADDAPTIEEAEAVTAGTAEPDVRDESAAESAAAAVAALSDEELLERARTATNGDKFRRLWGGDTSGYESHSEADMALCSLLAFWTGGDESRIDRLFRDSGLMRDKWDEQHYADGRTYGEKTIERAVAGTDECYDPEAAASGAGSETDAGTTPTTATAATTANAGPQDGPVEQEATVAALRNELQVVRAREREQLELIDELRAEVERLDRENQRLRAQLAETTGETDAAEAGDADHTVFRHLRRTLRRLR